MISEEPRPEQFINIDGPRGESLFRSLLTWLLPSEPAEYQRELQREINEYWVHYEDLTDERAIVLVGSLCVEDCLDQMIDVFFPEANIRHKLSFSRKISLVRACKLIPLRILDDCNTVNQLRNDFAHTLKLRNLSDLGDQRFQAVDIALKRYVKRYDFNVTQVKRFKGLVSFIYIALIAYTTHVKSLREYIYTEDFMKALKKFKESEH